MIEAFAICAGAQGGLSVKCPLEGWIRVHWKQENGMEHKLVFDRIKAFRFPDGCFPERWHRPGSYRWLDTSEYWVIPKLAFPIVCISISPLAFLDVDLMLPIMGISLAAGLIFFAIAALRRGTRKEKGIGSEDGGGEGADFAADPCGGEDCGGDSGGGDGCCGGGSD